MELIFNQDFQGLFIYIIILVLCRGDDGELGEIIMTLSFMKNWGGKKRKELKRSQSKATVSSVVRTQQLHLCIYSTHFLC